jgi:GT2 family glycosyltransferase
MQGLDIEVFVVDNNSKDGSVEMVRDQFKDIILIANEGNPGFSIANNQAIRRSRGEYVLLLNPDTVVQEDTFSKCIEFMDAHPDAGSLGAKMIDGSGTFLPESKRGFPSPWVAFYKTFGLSKLFPKSKTFNHYHLGYLPTDETNEIEVLAGAFMFMRKTALDEVGLLDEAFFMYGEDIDLSYRIVKGGYKSYYFPEAKIIHYKGESTKKGSLNYVKVFYNAMIIFAKKHFKGQQASFFIFMMQMAIYLRAAITVFSNFFRKAYLPILDGLLMVLGMVFLKDFWATRYFDNPDYYPTSFIFFNVPLYASIWLGSIYFSGGYDDKYHINRILRGIVIGTILIAAVYGFLNMEYRTSRMLILMGAIWLTISMVALRLVFHLLEFKNTRISRTKTQNYVVVGSENESERVQQLLYKAQVSNNFIGMIAPQPMTNQAFLGDIAQLKTLVSVYKINEIIFCAKDISNATIISWMETLGTTVDYKIVPEGSNSVIGSSSKNTRGQLYTVEVAFDILEPKNKRNKRVADVLVALLALITLPLGIFIVKKTLGFIQNIFKILVGNKTWVGYNSDSAGTRPLPKIKESVLSIGQVYSEENLNKDTLSRMNFFYAKDYSVYEDLDVIRKGWRNLGN